MDRPSTSSAIPIARVPYIAKRSRKFLRRSEYFYGEEKDDELEPDCKISKTAEQVEDVCRCEYVVPELETRMDRLMDKMGFIETLAKTLLLKEEHREASNREELTNAHAEIAHLKRQIIIQRNQKSLSNQDHK
uniref:Uncharacterized protein n=1 Tax=Caenorhabditis japonica TaxID=281687 RepID=A0A8R1EPY2_CAEJA